MNKESELFGRLAPKVGSEFIKLKTGKVVRWDAFEEKTQIFEFKSAENWEFVTSIVGTLSFQRLKKNCGIWLRKNQVSGSVPDVARWKKFF